jgi:hypothetical protein
MKASRRFALLVPGVLATIGFAQVPALAQAPGTVPAGQISNASTTAGLFVSSVSANLNVQVSDNIHVANPTGGPSTTTHTTVLNMQAFNGTFFASGCYEIASSDFTFSINAAALHTTVTDTTATCGGFPGTFVTPFTLDVTWTGTGPVSTQGGESHFNCGDYGLETEISSKINAASAVATLSPIFADQFTGQSQLLRMDNERLQAEGVSPDGCQPFGAIPGGAGPPAAGVYHTTSTDVGIFFFSDTGSSVGIFVTKMTQTSHPKGAAATTTNELDVRINVFGGGIFANGCFNLTPSNFSSKGVQGATLNMTITVDTPTCAGFPASIALPQTLNVVWVGSGPVATTRSEGQFQCLTYQNEGTGLNKTNLANVTATLTPLLSGPLTSNQGSLATSDSRAHAQGAQQPACHL